MVVSFVVVVGLPFVCCSLPSQQLVGEGSVARQTETMAAKETNSIRVVIDCLFIQMGMQVYLPHVL